jgi:MFS family permease
MAEIDTLEAGNGGLDYGTPSMKSSPPKVMVMSSAYAPLRRAMFRWLWIASLASNIGTWMQNVGAAWLMTELSASVMMVALVQAATNLPFFVLAVPAGALADIGDRRRVLLVAQGWMLAVAVVLSGLTFAELMTPWLLLTMTFLLGLGSALNAPAWQASTPELVPREEIPAAVALGGVSMNVARAVGPALGGLVVAAVGPGATFLLNAVSFVGVLFVLAQWKCSKDLSALPAERLAGAMQAGLRFVLHAPPFQAVLVRATAFVLGASSLLALLPVVMKQDASLGPAHYGILLGCFGAGAVMAVLVLPLLVRSLNADRTVTAATLMLCAVILALAWLPYYWFWCFVLVFGGAAWLAALTRLNASAQATVPPWVRARALAAYLLVFFGGMAGGSVVWGLAAERVGPSLALTASATCLLVGLIAAVWFQLSEGESGDLEPSRHWPEMPAMPGLGNDCGPVLVTVEYHIDPHTVQEFMAAIKPLGMARLRDGAMWWDVFHDVSDPTRIIEVFMVGSLVDHLRQHERVTEADRTVQEQVGAFHRADTPPLVTHLIAGILRASESVLSPPTTQVPIQPSGHLL